MKIPFAQNERFLDEVNATASDFESARIWWLGQSGFLLQWQGKHLLLDPYLSDSLTHKYANTDKPHIRMTELVVAPKCLDFVDVVTSSHNHTDHLDGETLQTLMRVNPKMELVIPEANREFVCDRLNIVADWPRGLDAGQNILVRGFRIHGVPAAHEEFSRDSHGRYPYLGYVIEFGGFRIYHSGDTLRYSGMEEWLRPFSVDLALLPINGKAPERRVAGNLWGGEAARLAHDIGARCVVPCHYDMFTFNTATPDEFVAECKRLGQPYRVLENGEGMKI